jgi:hypothetical protein
LASTASFIEDFKEFHGEHSIVLGKLGLGVHFVSGVNLVDKRLGSNGAGKSSIWDALCWCLFGRTVSGLWGTDLRTWDSKTHAFVRVMVRVDGEKALIVRSTKTNGLWIDGKLCEQAAVDELIGLSYATFRMPFYSVRANRFSSISSRPKRWRCFRRPRTSTAGMIAARPPRKVWMV